MHGQLKDMTDEQLEMIVNLSESRIMQIDKDALRMREFQLMWTPQLEKDVVGYWRTLNGYWREKKLPNCTCLNIDGGFMGKRSKKGKVYNDFFFEDEPCSLKWFNNWKEGLKAKSEPLSPVISREEVANFRHPDAQGDDSSMYKEE